MGVKVWGCVVVWVLDKWVAVGGGGLCVVCVCVCVCVCMTHMPMHVAKTSNKDSVLFG